MPPDLSTTYLGLKLRSPLVVSASPRSEHIRNVECMADAGAGAIVFHSLFAEQLADSTPVCAYYRIDPDLYCQHISAAKAAVDIPVIANINALSPGVWVNQVKRLEDAGADALELNIYRVPFISDQSSADIESEHLGMVAMVAEAVRIPVAVKLTPYYTNFSRFAQQLEIAGAKGLVLFNRFAQPELGVENAHEFVNFPLSTPSEMGLPMHWVAALFGHTNCSLAATGGVQNGQDVTKMLMAGADVVFLCSVLLRRGVTYLSEMERDLKNWMGEHGYVCLDTFRGAWSHLHESDGRLFERAGYIRALTHSEHRLNVRL